MRNVPRHGRGIRADVLLVQRGLATSRTAAAAAIKAGCVTADGRALAKPSQTLDADSRVSYARAHPYVSRGGLKLAGALDRFGFSPAGKICLDLGASTGGFTQVLLDRGAGRVYAIDVGHGQLADAIRRDPRVVALEGMNARDLTAERIPEPVEMTVADVSFISLKLALPPALALAAPHAVLVVLFKPQFEVGRKSVGKGGIVRDAGAREAALQGFVTWLANQHGWSVAGTMQSPVTGGDGNVEYLVAARHDCAR